MISTFTNFPPVFSKCDIAGLLKNYAEEERLLSQPRKMLIFSLTLQNGTLITPLLLLGLVCTKGVLTTLQRNASTVFCSQQGTQEGKVTKVQTQVAETMNLLANSSYGYQIMDGSRHTETKYHNDKKTHPTINS